ncbi:hypothetical protein WJX84_001062 [Apatococcus fuscideae]|uniref:Uncharacterized protein n=1 Tax=Apatococcus fuscideae TaxID=2026836 RepID=A0AAW1TBF7_9CHLO
MGLIPWLVLLVFFLSTGSYLLLALFSALPARNLKKAYNAKWALVTGASSGIGLALTKKLAKQGLNVVVVALNDQLLHDSCEELTLQHPATSFRKVGVDLASPGFMPGILDATRDLDIQVVFCNAGYMLTGFFHTLSVEKQLANMHCNATSAVEITHYFLSRMTAKKLRGCFVYTSSAAAAIPSPFSVLYAATKSFLSSFGASLAIETKHLGIDVLVFHPSPVSSRFYDKAHKIDVLEMFKKLAVDADALPDIVFANIGRCETQYPAV